MRLVSNVDAFSSVVNTDVIVHANSHYTDSGAKFTNIAGINSFLKGGDSSASSTMFNTLLGTVGGSASAAAAGESIFGEDINVNEKPEHKSLFRNLNSSLLTEHTLRQILRRFHAAKAKHGQTIDTLVASDGVWLGYESTKIGREILDRTGRLSSLATQGSEGGSPGGANDQFNSGFNFTMDGKSYTGYTSCYVEEGTMYGLKMGGGNYKKYVPPSISGTSSPKLLKCLVTCVCRSAPISLPDLRWSALLKTVSTVKIRPSNKVSCLSGPPAFRGWGGLLLE